MKTHTLKIILLTTALVVAVFLAQAQDKKISQLPALPSVSGGEAIPLAISGTNYYLTPNQLKTWLNIVGYVPLSGTLNSAPLTGTIEYRGTNATVLVDTISSNSFIIGSGNLKDLNNATKKAMISFSGNASHTNLTLSSSSTISGTSLSLRDNLFSLGISNNSNSSSYGFTSAVAGFGIYATDATGAYITKLNTTPTSIFLQSTNPVFKGANYETATCNLINSNRDSTSILHQGEILRLITTSNNFIPITGTSTGNPLTGTIEFNNSSSTLNAAIWKNTSLGTPYFIGTSDNKNFVSSSHGAFTQYSDGQIIQSAYNVGGAQGVLNLTTGGAEISSYNAGVNTRFFQLNNMTFVQSANTGYVGIGYETTTAGYVASNGSDYQIFHRLYNDARYAPISSALSGTGYVYQTGSTTSYTTSIPNSSLSNSTFTVNGTAMALGTSSTITSAAGTLTGTGLNSSVVTSSLTTVGTVTTGVWNSGIAPVVGTTTSAATITINTDSYNMYTVTSLSTATTFTVPTGTPKAGQSLIIRIKDNGTARALTFSTGTNGFRFSSDFPAPTTTTLSKTMYIGFRWNEADSKWDNISPYIDNF